jgi:hypothetical protein
MKAMTSLLAPPDALTSPNRVAPPPWLCGAGAGLLAAAGGVVAAMGIAVAGWLSGSTGTMSDALQVGAGAWLLGHGYALRVDSAAITLMPLGLSVALGLALFACTAGAVRLSGASQRRALLQVVATCAFAYVVVAAGVVALVTTSSAGVELGRGAAGTVAFAAVAATAGALRHRRAQVLAALPPPVVAIVRGAIGGALAMVGLAALTLTASLGLHVAAMREIVGSLQLGFLGGVVLVAACVVVLPNVVLLTAAVMLGPGIAVGAGTSVTLTEVTAGPLPALPWLAAVPEPGAQPVPLALLAALPVLAGVVAGVSAVRRRPDSSVMVAAGTGLAAGALAGLLIGGAIATAGGSIGPARMAAFGAPELLSLAVAVGALGFGGLLGGTSTRLLAWRAERGRAGAVTSAD